MSLGIPQTVAIIMDGNGRWAKAKGLPRTAGHKQGANNVRDIALACNELGIKKLILYAFSTENWKRPEDEVGFLCKLPGIFFNMFIKELMEKNIRVTFAGELNRFPQDTQDVINKAVGMTEKNTGLELCLAINYGSRRELLLGIQKYADQVAKGERTNDITEEEVANYLMVPEDIDLMIRTSGEQRISNYLLWQIAYAELIFTPVAWPDFDQKELNRCIQEYQNRDRRFGGLTS
ncbi:MAG: isoprenyl transferase [Firmicutes bacterium]|nr:isoprenyl transferase [Bacillota bacterium]